MDTRCHSNDNEKSYLQHEYTQNTNDLNGDNTDHVTIIHFNDCYNIEPGPQSSGAAGFLTAVNQYRNLNPMILFSGDIISPSFLSTFTKGEQMIPVLNDIGVECAVFGNHEFDFGVENLINITRKTSCKWVLSNVIDKETSNQLGDGLEFYIIERGGFKFGIIGLIEEDWLSSLATLDSSDVIYQDFVKRGQQLGRILKSEPHGVDYVIALTHFRKPNDILLADSVPEIDLILGGHDHDYGVYKRPNCTIVKSGTDFREFSLIKLTIDPKWIAEKKESNGLTGNDVLGNKLKPFLPDIGIERISCCGYKADPDLEKKLDKFVTSIDEKMGQVLAQFNCDLDGRFASIRNYETNLGNFVTDIMLASTHADLAILNSGTLRSDRIHPRGDFTMRDLYNILGYIDPITVLNATGDQVWRALENGVSQWPKLEGRFPQVSGCSFEFDPNKPPMQRIDTKNIYIGDEQLVLDKVYKLTTKDYLASGKDGYDVFKECEVLLDSDETPDLTTSILNHFEAINIIKSNRRTHHRQSVICVSRSSLKKMISNQTTSAASTVSSVMEDSIETSNNNNNNYGTRQTGSLSFNSSSSGENLSSSRSLSNNANNDNLNITSSPHDNGMCEPGQHQTYSIDQPSDSNNNTKNSNSIINGTISLLRETISQTNENSEFISSNLDDFHLDDNDSVSLNCFDTSNRVANGANSHSVSSNSHIHQLASSPLVGKFAPDNLSRNQLLSESERVNCTPSAPKIISFLADTPQLLNLITPKCRPKRLMSVDEVEHEQCKLEPKIEGRIRIVGINV